MPTIWRSHLHPLNLYELAKGCVQSLKLNAANHDIEISCQGSDCTVNGNKDMLEELLYNLCDNAIRYNKPGGSVRVNIGMYGEHVLLTVKDTGISVSQRRARSASLNVSTVWTRAVPSRPEAPDLVLPL